MRRDCSRTARRQHLFRAKPICTALRVENLGSLQLHNATAAALDRKGLPVNSVTAQVRSSPALLHRSNWMHNC